MASRQRSPLHHTTDPDVIFAGPAFLGGLSRQEAIVMVEREEDGCYVLRFNETHSAFILTININGLASGHRVFETSDGRVTLDHDTFATDLPTLMQQTTRHGFYDPDRPGDEPIFPHVPVEEATEAFYTLCGWYRPDLDRSATTAILARASPGSMLIRGNKQGGLTLAVTSNDGSVSALRITRTFAGYYVGASGPFPSLMTLLEEVVADCSIALPQGGYVVVTKPIDARCLPPRGRLPRAPISAPARAYQRRSRAVDLRPAAHDHRYAPAMLDEAVPSLRDRYHRQRAGRSVPPADYPSYRPPRAAQPQRRPPAPFRDSRDAYPSDQGRRAPDPRADPYDQYDDFPQGPAYREQQSYPDYDEPPLPAAPAPSLPRGGIDPRGAAPPPDAYARAGRGRGEEGAYGRDTRDSDPSLAQWQAQPDAHSARDYPGRHRDDRRSQSAMAGPTPVRFSEVVRQEEAAQGRGYGAALHRDPYEVRVGFTVLLTCLLAL